MSEPEAANASGDATSANSATEEWSVGQGDYLFLMFLTLLNVMNFVDRQLLAHSSTVFKEIVH